jgi:hypothetical protein
MPVTYATVLELCNLDGYRTSGYYLAFHISRALQMLSLISYHTKLALTSLLQMSLVSLSSTTPGLPGTLQMVAPGRGGGGQAQALGDAAAAGGAAIAGGKAAAPQPEAAAAAKGRGKSKGGKSKGGIGEVHPAGRKDLIAVQASAALRFLALAPGFQQQLLGKYVSSSSSSSSSSPLESCPQQLLSQLHIKQFSFIACEYCIEG